MTVYYTYQRYIITNIIIVGNYQKAEKLYSKLLKRVRVKLGESDPFTLGTMMNLANTYNSQGKHRDAEVLLKQCLDKRKEVLGENHPETIRTISVLALVASIAQSQEA